MNALIIEDEKAALRNLKALLAETAPEITVVGELDSIFDSLAWFQASPMPDVVFLDIHLADGSAFEIFEHTTITCPIIFTTAYDEYALRAFRVNSIDYLLKPINRPDLQRALDKLRRFALPLSAPDLGRFHPVLLYRRRTGESCRYRLARIPLPANPRRVGREPGPAALLPRQPAVPDLQKVHTRYRSVVQWPALGQPESTDSRKSTGQQGTGGRV